MGELEAFSFYLAPLFPWSHFSDCRATGLHATITGCARTDASGVELQLVCQSTGADADVSKRDEIHSDVEIDREYYNLVVLYMYLDIMFISSCIVSPHYTRRISARATIGTARTVARATSSWPPLLPSSQAANRRVGA